MAKTNFRYLMIAHLAAMILLGILLLVLDKGNRYVLRGLLYMLAGSAILQLLIWKIKPSWFAPKTGKHPDLP